MNILLILHENLNPNSGSAGSTLNLGKYYQELGHQVHFFSNDDLPSIYNRHIKRLLFPVYVAYYLQTFLRSHNIDVIDSSPCDTWLWSMFWRQWHKKTPLLVTRSHGLLHFDHIQYIADGKLGNINISWKYPLYHGSIHLWEEQYSICHSDLVFMLNSQEKKYVKNELQVSDQRIYVFPNGLPDNFLNLPFEKVSVITDSPIRIAQIGTFTQRKGIDYSIPALISILNTFQNVHVSLIGTELNGVGDINDVYSHFDKSLHSRIHVIPYYVHEKLPNLLREHHIKLFPTLSEGFGKVLIEAMACGLAPITTLAPGPQDVVQDGYDALIVQPRDSQSIEQALNRLILDRSYLNDLRCNAYDTAQNYSWKHIAKQRLSVYTQALAKRQTSSCLQFR